MAKHTDEELIEILSVYRNDYQPDAIIAAENELKNRNITLNHIEEISVDNKDDISTNIVDIVKNKSPKLMSFYISFVYVLLGTIYSYLYWTSANPLSISDMLGGILFIVFLPVSFLPIAIIFSESEPNFLIIITQIITFFILWASVNAIIQAYNREKSDICNVKKNG